jgi:hypothetical protein
MSICKYVTSFVVSILAVGRIYYLSMPTDYVKYDGHNLKVLTRRHL